MYRSREWIFERTRRDRRLDPTVSGRMLAQRYKVSRNTVAKALVSPVPSGRKKPPPRESVLEPVKGFIDSMLHEDLQTWKKQKHTVDRILERLAGEHDFEQASYSTVRDYVRKRRPQIVLEAKAGRRHLEGTVPQERRPGAAGHEQVRPAADAGDRHHADEKGHQRMSPTATVKQTAEQIPSSRMPLPESDPEDALVDEACRDLRLPAFRERFMELSATARREQSSYKQFLLDLLQVERADRDIRRQQRLVRSARFPRPKRLEDFDFDRNPNVLPETLGDQVHVLGPRGPPAGADR
ncbi:ATP-binding protein [Streptomyces violaceusniger]|uniref:ATP-binding protein n=1 Tax=Streptomyces violaceusniger TaxID=68280 RepID=UPI003803553B